MRQYLLLCGLVAPGCSGEGETVVSASATLSSRHLAVRTAVEGPRFRRLDPAVTGLDFAHELRRENVVPYVYSGSGLAVGDYDGDGLPDLYMVSQDGPNRLFRQTAPLRFEDVTAAAGGLDGGAAWGTAAAFADLDGDGDLDLYVCNLEAPNLLYENQGDGTFREVAAARGLDFVAASTGVAFADYDRDGDLDMYLLTNRVFGARMPAALVAETTIPADTRKSREQMFPPYPKFGEHRGEALVPQGYEDFFFTMGPNIFVAGQPDRLVRNEGGGRWRDVAEAAGIADQGNGLSVVWWDMDGDGWPDLYVANDLESPDRLYRNRRDGTFEEVSREALPYTPYFAMGSDFGDVDNDGHLDLCVADMSSTTHYMGKMLMGSMADKRWFLMNADPPQQMRNMLYLGTGTGRFLEAAQMAGVASTDWTWTLRLADLDDDGWLDLYATNGIPLFEDNPDTAGEFTRLWRSGQREQALELARSIPPVAERNVARRNRGDLSFEDVGAAWGLDEAGVSYGAVVVDLDRDGDLDIVVNNMNAPASVYENRGADAHRILVELRGTTSNHFGVGARIIVVAGGTTQTRLVAATRGYMSAGEPVEHFGLGAARRIDRLEVRWPSGIEQVFEDLEVNRCYTIREEGRPAGVGASVTAAAPTWFEDVGALPVRHAERPFDDYAQQALLPHRLSQLGPGLACGDVDGDGRDEVWIGGAAGQAGTLLRAGPAGAFVPVEGPWFADADCEDMGAVFVDHDGDGDLDLYVVSGGVEAGDDTALLRDRLYVNDGGGRFEPAPAGTLPDLRFSGSSVCAADFDRDGDLDLFVGGRLIAGRFPHAPSSALLRNEAGRFVDATAAVAPGLLDAGMVAGAVWTDLDDDGWIDLVVAAQWQPVRVFGNEGGLVLVDRTGPLGLAGIRGQWNGVAAGDLDLDGDIDLVVTNLGLNTKYRADRDHPLRIYAADFDTDGELDVVEAKQDEAGELPIRGRSCSSAAMPFLAERFPTFDAFARASLPEIYGPDALAGSFEVRVDELRSLVLENRGSSFVARPLPRLAQIAPGFGVGIADFDADGRPDIVLAQNFHGPEPETGRFAGGLGLILAGRGGMRFEPVPAERSGVVMPGDAMGLAILDIDADGRPDFVATINDGPVRSFVSRSTSASLAVRLAGPIGNPGGIGARLSLVGADGRVQVCEIGAGSGYLGQGAAQAFFSQVPAGAELRLRWPDGSTATRPLPVLSGTVTISR
jgi:hypothetical protein